VEDVEYERTGTRGFVRAEVSEVLRSPIPINRILAAALAVIEQPLRTRGLLLALRESDDQEVTAEARAALLELRDPAAAGAVVD
jgi:hypothetical protein